MEKTNNGKKGGWLVGKRHYDKSGKPIGGIPAVVGDSKRPVELEGGEVIINREASRKYWRELSKINQSAGNGVPIKPQDVGADEDPEEFREGGKVIEFNPNHIPNKRIYNYAKSIKKDHPEIWDLGGNIFGNEAFNNLERVIKRGYWTDSEEWMYVKWRSYVARHKQDFRIAGVIAMLKWVDKVDKGWDYMKNLIEEEIEKRKPKKKTGGVVTYKKKYNKKYGYKENESHDLEQVSKDTGVSEKGLQQIYNKGVGAYKTNPQSVRPNVKSKEQWAMARVYSAVMGGKAARVDANELRMENGGDVDDIFEITTYYVTAHTDSFINEIYIGNDYKRAVSEFNSSNTTEDVGSDLGGTILFQKKTEKYKFVGDLEDGAYDISDFPFEDFYNDKDYYELIEEGEIEDIDSKTVNPVNEKTDELLYDVRKHYGDSKYNTIVVDNGEEQSSDNYQEYGCIQLRIADHSENVKNIDRAGNCEYYISVVIANKDATKGKFAASVYERKRNEVELNFDSNSTFDEIISNIDSAIEKGKKYIIGKDKMRNGGKIENKLKNNAHEKPNTSKNETKNIEKAISYISRGVATVKNQQSRSLSENRLKDLEAQLAFEFAKSNNLWIEDLDLLAKPIAGGGNENSLYYDEEKGIIYKSNNLHNSDFSILKYLNYILNHNSLFKNTQYEFVGFIGFSNGYDDIKSAIPYIEPVVCQKFIVGKNSSEGEIKKHMESLGYNKTNEHTYENNQFLISDLRPRNILKDANGNIFVIDNIIKEKVSKKMENGGIVLPEQGTMLTKDKKLKLDYKKVGNNYEFVVYEVEKNPVENYRRTSFKKKDKNVVTMDYNQFINYLYEEGYIDNKKMENGGELAKGIKTEQEHKKTLEKIASGEITVDEAIKMTAKDHLKENPKYYTELSKIEKHEVGGALSGYSLNTPTGEKSRLTYLQQILVRTQKFKDFFGDWEVAAKSYLLDEKDNFQKHYKNVSKVLDMVTLEPRVVYHGTRSDAEFFTFDVSMEKGQGRP